MYANGKCCCVLFFIHSFRICKKIAISLIRNMHRGSIRWSVFLVSHLNKAQNTNSGSMYIYALEKALSKLVWANERVLALRRNDSLCLC